MRRMPPDPGFLAPDWPAPAWVKAAVTTRADGISRGPFAGANLAEHVGDDSAAVAENRARLQKRLALPATPCWMIQQHGNRVVEACSELPHADACVARRPNVVCAVLTADCLPLLLCDAERAVVAAVHVGWRGLSRGIIDTTLTVMAAAPSALLAWLGPAICKRHYQVGPEVRDAVLKHGPYLAAAFADDGDQRWRLDLSGASTLVLRRAGVASVTPSGLCTFTDPRFYSHRRGQPTGRMAALIWMEPA
jgi:YfiH family protein